MISVIDYKIINLGSIVNMLKKVEAPFEIVSEPKQLEKAQKVILPGIGSFDRAIEFLEKNNLRQTLDYLAIEKKVPFMGVCLGMQLMCKSSEEGQLQGLGYVEASCKKFKFDSKDYKVPHMGWNEVRVKKDNPVFLDTSFRKFYFVHSYYVECEKSQDVLTETEHGHIFTSSFQKDNLFGFQFHPEKSHKYGMELFRNFHRNV